MQTQIRRAPGDCDAWFDLADLDGMGALTSIDGDLTIANNIALSSCP